MDRFWAAGVVYTLYTQAQGADLFDWIQHPLGVIQSLQVQESYTGMLIETVESNLCDWIIAWNETHRQRRNFAHQIPASQPWLGRSMAKTMIMKPTRFNAWIWKGIPIWSFYIWREVSALFMKRTLPELLGNMQTWSMLSKDILSWMGFGQAGMRLKLHKMGHAVAMPIGYLGADSGPSEVKPGPEGRVDTGNAENITDWRCRSQYPGLVLVLIINDSLLDFSLDVILDLHPGFTFILLTVTATSYLAS
ncbi:hypothetical protein BJ170DRAFT_589852 [Xylariales sp. AK1849]|nr:hypothetical protein BJ170DRAFT_589852 [Xylariales sp. AK1849]